MQDRLVCPWRDPQLSCGAWHAVECGDLRAQDCLSFDSSGCYPPSVGFSLSFDINLLSFLEVSKGSSSCQISKESIIGNLPSVSMSITVSACTSGLDTSESETLVIETPWTGTAEPLTFDNTSTFLHKCVFAQQCRGQAFLSLDRVLLVALVGLERTIETRWALNLEASFCLCLLSAGITAVPRLKDFSWAGEMALKLRAHTTIQRS